MPDKAPSLKSTSPLSIFMHKSFKYKEALTSLLTPFNPETLAFIAHKDCRNGVYLKPNFSINGILFKDPPVERTR